MSLTTFRLPRHLPGVSPRVVSRRIQEDIPVRSALEGWNRGFSKTEAIDYIDELGATLPTRPDDPNMPADITILTSDELGRLHAQFVAYTGWIEVELSLVEVISDEEEAFLEHVEAEVLLRKAGTVKDKTSKAINDPKYVEAEKVALIAKAKAKLLKARVKGYERCVSCLSREMSRRIADWERDRTAP